MFEKLICSYDTRLFNHTSFDQLWREESLLTDRQTQIHQYALSDQYQRLPLKHSCDSCVRLSAGLFSLSCDQLTNRSPRRRRTRPLRRKKRIVLLKIQIWLNEINRCIQTVLLQPSCQFPTSNCAFIGTVKDRKHKSKCHYIYRV